MKRKKSWKLTKKLTKIRFLKNAAWIVNSFIIFSLLRAKLFCKVIQVSLNFNICKIEKYYYDGISDDFDIPYPISLKTEKIEC